MACYTRSRKRKSMTKHFQLFNCDRTCSLTPISSLLHLVEKKSDFKIVVEERAFSQSDVDTLIEQVIPNLRMDYGVLTVHARDSIPFIEDGYGKICKAILQRMKVLGSGKKVIIVINGDVNYKEDENGAAFSQWAWKKISTQCSGDCLDRNQVFLLSWNKTYGHIHERALLQFLDPNNTGQMFVSRPRVDEPINPPVSQDVPVQPAVANIADTTTRDDDSPTVAMMRQPDTEAFTEGVSTHYQSETVLLSTVMRSGVVSYEAKDVKVWKDDQKWRLSSSAAEKLREDYKSTPTACVKLVTDSNGVVQVRVVEVNVSFASRLWNQCPIS